MSNVPPPTSYPPPPPPPPGGAPASSDRTLMIVLAYLGLLALIPYLTKKDDPEVHWHAKNGIGLLIFDVIIWVGLFVLQMAVGNTLVGCGMATVGCIVWVGVLVLHIYCLIQAVGGKRPRIPVVTDFAEKSL